MDSTDTLQTLTIPAREIRAGDVFTRHSRTRVALHDAQRHGRSSVVVEFDSGAGGIGCVWITADAEITVVRDMKGLRCNASATA
ncbi:hypothetical protein [Streptomyces hydrogenans]|uniref:hypothetical protein n=1 Tax=Streptomyces hydrogenans TaxID=1873719 RepID=UPI0035DC0AD9